MSLVLMRGIEMPGSNAVLLHLPIPGQSCKRRVDRLSARSLDKRSVVAAPLPWREDDRAAACSIFEHRRDEDTLTEKELVLDFSITLMRIHVL